MDDKDKALNYYRAGAMDGTPDYVPATVRIAKAVCGDRPFRATRVEPGDYACECNRYGAVSVRATNGCMLGLRLAEFEPLTWQTNPAKKVGDA